MSDGPAWERACTERLEELGVAYTYEPDTYVLEESEDGAPLLAFAPDFYIEECDGYIEATCARSTYKKRRKMRKCLERYPGVVVVLCSKADGDTIDSALASLRELRGTPVSKAARAAWADPEKRSRMGRWSQRP